MEGLEEYPRMWRFKGVAFDKSIYPLKDDVMRFAHAKGWIKEMPKPEGSGISEPKENIILDKVYGGIPDGIKTTDNKILDNVKGIQSKKKFTFKKKSKKKKGGD